MAKAVGTERERQLEQEVFYLKQELQLLKEGIAYLTRKQYGLKKETLDHAEQTNLFTEVIPELDIPEITGETKETITYTRTKKKGKRAAELAQFSHVQKQFELPESERICPNCQRVMADIGGTMMRQVLDMIPAFFQVVEYIAHAYACQYCKDHGIHSDVIKAPVPKAFIGSSLASPSILAETLIEKYEKKVPAFRQEKQWARLGVPITRQDIINWHILAADYGLGALHDLMKKELLTQDIIHADETPYKVIESEKSKTYYWLLASGRYAENQVILYEHKDGRSYNWIEEMLGDYSGFLQTDGYAVYQKLPHVVRVACLAHIRRKFFDALTESEQKRTKKATRTRERASEEDLIKIEHAKKSAAWIGVEYCDVMFLLEKRWHDLAPEDRKEKRQAILAKVMDAFYTWLGNLGQLPKTKLGKAVDYAFNQRDALAVVLTDGRLEISNNRAERAIKELVMGRKNWLFSTSFKGAQASGIILSVMRTAEANGLDTRAYLKLLFEELPNLPVPDDPNDLQKYLPWAPQMKERCTKQSTELE